MFEFKTMMASQEVDRQFVENIPQMPWNPWLYEIQDSGSPSFSSFNYMVLCDYHKYQNICVPLFPAHLLVLGHNAYWAHD